MASGCMIGKILLYFLLPAILSLNIVATGDPEENKSWLRFWVVLSFALLLELLLEKLEGAAFTTVKVLLFVFVVWCLAPVEYNGSDVVFQYVLLPVHDCVQVLATETTAIGLPLIIKSKEGVEDLFKILASTVLHPLLELVLNKLSEVATASMSFIVTSYEIIGEITHIWFQNMLPPINCAIAIFQKLAMEAPVYGWAAVRKVVEKVEETPEFAISCFHYCMDWTSALFNIGCEFASVAFEKLVEFSIFAFERIVEFCILAFEKIIEWSTKGGETIKSTLEDGVTYYKNNQKNPRLFSEAYKQLIYQ